MSPMAHLSAAPWLNSWLLQSRVTESDNHSLVISITIFVTLLCGCIVLNHLLENVKWLSESIVSLVLGLCTGAILLIVSRGTNSHLLQFNEELFFIYLLPPIIFNAGFQVKKKKFFENFASIMLYGAVGVFISFFIVSFGCKYIFPYLGVNLTSRSYLALGAIFSATDTVCTLQVLHQDSTPLLYSLVFGEGVVNDATSIVLFRTIQQLGTASIDGATTLGMIAQFLKLFVSSTLLGVGIGVLSAVISRNLHLGSNFRHDMEIAFMTLMAYLSYMIAELFYFSGILAVFFCGIVMSHYTWHNVSAHSKTTTMHTFATMSFIAETFIFMYVGMDALDADKWNLANKTQTFSLSGVILVLVFIGRAAFVFPLSFLANLFTRNQAKLNFNQQFVILWAGLIRGAVSVALAFNEFTSFGSTSDPVQATLITSTIISVLFSTMVLGMVTKPLIKHLVPHEHRALTGETNGDLGDLENPLLPGKGGPRRSSLRLLFEQPTSLIHQLWRSYDDKYMRPVFCRVPASQTSSST